MFPSTMSSLIAVWILQAAIGLVFILAIVVWSWTRWRWARRAADPNGRLLLSMGALLRNIGAALVQLCLLWVGIVAAFRPQQPDAFNPSVVLLLMASWILTGKALADFGIQWLILQQYEMRTGGQT